MNKKLLITLSLSSLMILSSCGKSETDIINKNTTSSSTENSTVNNNSSKNNYNEIGFDKFNFSAKDINNKEYNTEIFESSKVTMINFWATFCGPCINELKDINKLSEEFKSEDFQVMGIVTDAYEGDEDIINSAKKIIKDNNVKYLNIIPNDNLYTNYLNNLQFVPTTIFVNKNGDLIGPVVNGAKSYNEYKEIIENIIENLNE